MSEVRERLLTEAQHLIQTVGYNGFSFRDLANRIGIKSASIHYHFPTKADLGRAIAAQYAEVFMGRLNAQQEAEQDADKLLAFYASLFREALVDEGKMCLCGMLSAEASSLPSVVVDEAKQFFETNLNWLSAVYERRAVTAKNLSDASSPRAQAEALMASLQGALVLAKGLSDPNVFDRIVLTVLPR